MSQPLTALASQDHAPLLESAFPDAVDESAYALTDIEGHLPERLHGTWYVNGPARFARGERRYDHWLDGDGMVAALRLDAGGAHLTHRYVRSHKLVAEEEAGRALFRTFGTAFAGDRLQREMALASPVNVSAHRFGGKLLAFGEQGLPWELDPETLATRGEYTFGGALNGISPFSAHPCFDPDSGEMFNFGASFSATNPTLSLYRFAADGERLYRRRHRLPWPCSMHDFGLSEHFAVFHVSPYLLDMEAFQRNEKHLMDCLDWRPELGTELWVLDRADGALLHRVPIGEGYCLHLIHCRDTEHRLHVDVIEMDQPVYDQYLLPDLFPQARTAAIRRYSIDRESGRLVDRRALDSDLMCDFPAVDPRAGLGNYDAFWVLGIGATRLPGRKFFDRLVRFEWDRGREADSYAAPEGSYLGGEPVFLPHPTDSGQGFTLCQMFDARRRTMSLVLFDAFSLEGGPITTMHLERPIHLGFHASWHPA